MMSGRKQYMAIRKRWLIKSIAGLMLFGFGLCLVGEAIVAKYDHEPWLALGTISLVITNSGLSIFVSAAIDRVRMLDLRG